MEKETVKERHRKRLEKETENSLEKET